MASVFFSYSHADEALRGQLETQLALLKRQGVITVWHDRRIGAGQEFAQEIDRHIETDDIVLLLVSADFLASDYCYDKEMLRAMERHEAGEAIVIPVILRACDWHEAPFGKLNATPPNGKPVTQFPDRDEGFLEVVKAVRGAVTRLTEKSPTAKASPAPATPTTTPPRSISGPRSSNLRVTKQFSDREKDAFRVESFEYMAKYFENSLAELSQRNAEIETQFRRIDANRFLAKVYKNGKAVAQCHVFMGGGYRSDGIAYSSSDTLETNAYNEMLTVHADDQSLYLRGMGMAAAMGRATGEGKLTSEGASEHYWSMLIERLQQSR